MKKLLLIMMCTLFLTILSSSFTVCAWAGAEHEKITEKCSPCARLSPSQTRLAVYCSTLADKDIYRKDRLHGTGDYVKYLEFLYTCAFNLKNNVPNPLESALDKSCKIPGYHKLYKDVNHLLLDEVLLGDEEKSNSAKAAKILGFACHLTGDIYAHRTIIPANATEDIFKEGWNSWKANKIRKDPSFENKLPPYEAVLGDSLKKGRIGKTQIDEQKANFLMIKKWMTRNPLAQNYAGYLANAFEDNPSFYKERYEVGAMQITQNMMTLYGENLPYCADAIFQTDCSIPIQPPH